MSARSTTSRPLNFEVGQGALYRALYDSAATRFYT